ncbi:MAG: AAA family ATPase [Pseudolabrys sp.]
MTADANDVDDLEMPAEDDVASSGAAAETAEWNEKLQRLPRILRYAVLAKRRKAYLRERLVAEIAELSPGLTQTVRWVYDDDLGHGFALAAELDRLAATRDRPDLRSLADCARLLSLPLPGAPVYDHDHRRVAKALVQAASQLPPTIDLELAAEIEAISLGWAVLPTSMDALTRLREEHAITAAYHTGRHMMQRRVALTEATLRKEFAEERQAQEKAKAKAADQARPAAEVIDVPEDHVLVCQLSDADMKNAKLREIMLPLKPAINIALPLVPVPPLHEVRDLLLFEFPYAEHVIDFALADLVGRRTIRFRPLLLVGDPGGGKSRFVRRMSEILNLGCWRTDASRSDGATFGGTDKRWYSAEPSHAFLAIARVAHANPVVLIDELEKAGTRSDYGRLWDCLLAFLEPETAARYPDPALQVTLDLSHVSYIATANSVDPLPSPLRDRFRIVTFPKPRVEHLDALLPPVIADLAAERGLDSRWIEPLCGEERDAIAAHWRGGSVRRLRRIVEVVLRAREKATVRN